MSSGMATSRGRARLIHLHTISYLVRAVIMYYDTIYVRIACFFNDAIRTLL